VPIAVCEPQQGFQQATIDGVTDRFSASFVQVGLGAGVRL
jgi:hypothetical protein